MSVKDKKRGRPLAEGEALSQERIIQAAKLQMKESRKVPSIRALASSLNVDAMAIYHYFKNKQALLEALTCSLVDEIYEPSCDEKWQTELQQLSASYLQLLDDYPGLLTVLLSMDSVGPAQVFQTRFEEVTQTLELQEQAQQDAICLLVDYLHGFALAMECNPDREALNVSMTSGAVALICKAIEA
ncbi:TetR/AcrR family transcriptional regulator [Pseudoalteromonas piscicida]|uniref:TetR/AcrR family transcriptional regulator n=1 Tax=Pseudoalteromonas piscicida TaxID=43662 RepID=A0AAQ2EVB8_PSEO7|nr:MULTISPECIES: TetR/AcrR family transcriptional regulator [Pseudoalteromonas]KJY85719.1 transcriptional regulator [Pseudoalteromonas piscicida]TMN35102.1 TetR/AcrR family transcriptional regulator [Pseudoalteromonas piscicida]TMN36177.1 TetR/AcrR family transcriptional regulator [Pseudoalteromonas piscicida]TMN47451.1 TetR/AcrR family transcriptional regulator [Pseudoalteromonas piscicida]TMN49976.1 TetR/AcrR family transcriptional regulator [Pseudoalteromonas piscicida]